MRIDGIFRVYKAIDKPLCFICSAPLLVLEKMCQFAQDLQVGRGRLVRGVRVNCEQQSFRVDKRICCGCNVFFAAQSNGDEVRYAFRCRLCDSYTAELSALGWCLLCTIERACGILDMSPLVDTLHESEGHLTPSRDAMVTGLLKGLLGGYSGLTCDDP